MTRRSVIDRSRVIQLHNEGKIPAEIIRITKFSRKFVARWVAAAQDPTDKPRPGSPSKLSQSDRVTIRAMLKGKKGRSTRKVAALFSERKHKPISHVLVHSIARDSGLKPYRKPSKPLLTADQRHRRLEFVELYKDTDWRKVLFTDETSFVLFGRPNRKNDVIWEDQRENVPVLPKVKHASKVHVWGAISYYGKLDLYLFTENLDSKLYIKILTARLPQAPALFPRRTYMMLQDSDPKHCSKETVKWMDEHVPSYIPKDHWPANSPDINVIEPVWAVLKDNVYGREPRTVDALKRIIREEWAKLDLSFLRNLVDSMPRRFAAVVANQGAPTKY
jgi:transposase